MTRAKAASVAALLVAANYAVSIIPSPDGSINSGWTIKVRSEFGTDVQNISDFATQQSVTAKTTIVELS